MTEWSITAEESLKHTANTIITVAEALDAAGAPRTDTQRDGVGVNLELGLAARIRWLAQERDDAARLSEAADSALSELHVRLRKACAAESVSEALDRVYAQRNAQEKLDHFVSQRDAEVDALQADFMKQRDAAVHDAEFFKKQANDSIVSLRQVNADREHWKYQCIAHERTIHKLAAKVDAFESAPRFAFSTDSHDLLLRASYVIDIPTGLVIKSRKGKAHTLDEMPTASKKKRATSKTTKPKNKSKSKKG